VSGGRWPSGADREGWVRPDPDPRDHRRAAAALARPDGAGAARSYPGVPAVLAGLLVALLAAGAVTARARFLSGAPDGWRQPGVVTVAEESGGEPVAGHAYPRCGYPQGRVGPSLCGGRPLPSGDRMPPGRKWTGGGGHD
jgi:hypothetical protein